MDENQELKCYETLDDSEVNVKFVLRSILCRFELCSNLAIVLLRQDEYETNVITKFFEILSIVAVSDKISETIGKEFML